MTPSSTVELTTLRLRGSLPGPDSPLPPFASLRRLKMFEVGEGVDDAMQARLATGRLTNPLPYARQSDYDRADGDVELPAVRLSNGVLTATVLPSLGGRLWSLFDHSRDRELLFVNPILRFANLGLTDAWFAGGIEWNLGTTGHTTLTARPVHAATISTPTGEGVRLWEWERTRDLVQQLDLTLHGDRLFVSTRVINPDPEPKGLYYWTNIAVPETPGTRVLAPADHAWRTDYRGWLSLLDFPHPRPDQDASYPYRAPNSVDYFMKTAAPGRFVAAVEPDGHGFAQTSTDELQGRKLFCWGTSSAGDHWQEWLSGPNARYAEIQAGWCTTQLEHDVIAGSAEVSWTEAFGAVDLPAATVSGAFDDATRAVAAELATAASPDALTTWHAQWQAEVADVAPAAPLHTGSGWGAVETLLRGDGARLPRQAVPFPSVDDDSAPARAVLADDPALLRRTADRLAVPPVSARWGERLAAPRWDDEPWVRYARAVGAHDRGEDAAAEQEYAASLALGGTIVGAPRGRALLAAARGDVDAAVEHYEAALMLAPEVRTLVSEYVELLLDAGRAADALVVLERVSPPVRGHGRNRLLEAFARVRVDDHAGAAALLDGLVVEDLAEGSLDVEDLWRTVHPDEPVPPTLDFRMHPKDPEPA